MASEPIVIYSRMSDISKVPACLKRLGLDVEVTPNNEHWTRIVVSVQGERKWLLGKRPKLQLVLTFDPEYCSEPNWSQQLSGMQGYFSKFPATARQPQVLMLIDTFRSAIGTLFEPEQESGEDPRLNLISEVTRALDGILFLPTSLRDPSGRIIYSSEGEADEDPVVDWPKVLAEVEIDPNAVPSDDEIDVREPPTAERIVRRAMVLTAVSYRGMLERDDPKDPETHEAFQDLTQWLDAIDLWSEFEPEERSVVMAPIGKLPAQTMLDAIWRLEGLAVLAWALGVFNLPPHDELVAIWDLWNSLHIFEAEDALNLIRNPQLKPAHEIKALRQRLFALHWRLRNYRIHPGVMDFAEFARTAWFGPLRIEGIPLVKGDLALKGKRLDKANPDDFDAASSTATERHQAANWLLDGPVRYSEASTHT